MGDLRDIRAELARIKALATDFQSRLSRLRADGSISGLDLLRFEKIIKEILADERKLAPGPVEREFGMRNCSYGRFESKRRRH